MDLDRLEDIFAEMEDYSIPEDKAKIWNKVRDAAAKYDYDAISGIMKEAEAQGVL